MDKWPNFHFHFSLTEDKLPYFPFQVMVRRLLVVGWRSWIVAHTEASSLPPVSRRLSSRGDLSRDRFAISKHLQWNELLSFVLSQILWISLCSSCSSQTIRLPGPPFSFQSAGVILREVTSPTQVLWPSLHIRNQVTVCLSEILVLECSLQEMKNG